MRRTAAAAHFRSDRRIWKRGPASCAARALPGTLVFTRQMQRILTVRQITNTWRPGRPWPAPQYGVPANALPLTASEDRQWATLAHFAASWVASRPCWCTSSSRTADPSPPPVQEKLTLRRSDCRAPGQSSRFYPRRGEHVFAVLATVIWIALTCFSVAAGIHANRGQPHRYDSTCAGSRSTAAPGPGSCPVRQVPAWHLSVRPLLVQQLLVRQQPADDGVGQEPVSVAREAAPEGQGRVHEFVAGPGDGVPPGLAQPRSIPASRPGVTRSSAGRRVKGFRSLHQ